MLIFSTLSASHLQKHDKSRGTVSRRSTWQSCLYSSPAVHPQRKNGATNNPENKTRALVRIGAQFVLAALGCTAIMRVASSSRSARFQHLRMCHNAALWHLLSSKATKANRERMVLRLFWQLQFNTYKKSEWPQVSSLPWLNICGFCHTGSLSYGDSGMTDFVLDKVTNLECRQSPRCCNLGCWGK